MASDGVINIDFNMPLDKIKSDAQKVKETYSQLGSDIKDDFKDPVKPKVVVNTDEVAEKVAKSGEELKHLPSVVRTELVANANKAGIDNFDELLKRLPKKTQTELLAKVEKGEVINYDDLLKKLPAKVVTEAKFNDNASDKLKTVQKEAANTSSRFSRLKDVMMGSFAGQAIFTGISTITSGLKGMVTAGIEYNKAQQTSLASWTTLTDSASKGKEMVNMANDLSTKFGQARDMTDELDQQFYHVLDNAPKTKTLTTSFLTLADTIGLSSDQVKTLGMDFTHTMSSGKVQLGDFNQLTDYLPMLGENMLKYEQKVQKNSKLTMTQLRDQMSAGKISAKDAETVINGLGDKYKESADNMMNTLPGMERAIKAKAPALASALVNPFLTAENPIAKSVMKWVNDPATMKGMSSFGKKFTPALNSVASGALKVFSAVGKIAGPLTKIAITIGKGVFETFGDVISGIAGAFGSLGSKAGGSFHPINSISDALGAISKHKTALKAVGSVLATYFAVSKFVSMATAVSKFVKAFSLFGSVKSAIDTVKISMMMLNSAILANPFVAIAAAIIAVGVGFYEAYKHIKPFRDAVNGVVYALKKLVTGNYGWEKDIAKEFTKVTRAFSSWTKSFKKGWDSFWSGIGSIIGSWGKGISKTWSSIWNGISKVAKGVWNGLKIAAKVAFTAIKVVALAPLVLLAASIVAIWKLIEKPTKAAWKLIEKYIVDPVKNIYKATVKEFKQLGKDIEGVWKSITKVTKSIWNPIAKFLKNTAKAIWSGVTKNFNSLRKGVTAAWNAISKVTSAVWNPIKKFVVNVAKAIWKGVSKHFNSLKKAVTSIWDAIKSVTKRVWNATGGWVIDKAEKIWKGITKKFNSLKKDIGGILDNISDKWHSMWNGVADFFGGVWKGIKKTAGEGINDVIKFIDGGINGINSLIQTFGGGSKTIAPINPIKLATGTGAFGGPRRAITRPTMALLNDGFDSPETGNQETLMHANGQAELIQGNNVMRMLEPGAEVFNATETKMLGLNHFASGTGFFGDIMHSVGSGIGGAVNWVGEKVKDLEKFFKTAENIIAHPVKSLESMYKWTDGVTKGVMTDIGKGLFDNSKKQATTWWSTLWGAVSDKLDDGGGGSNSDLVNNMEKYGATNKYIYGAEGPTAFDCSGLVEYTLKKMGISFPRTSGAQFGATKRVSDPKPGDLVFFGPGGSDHVGVYTGNGEFYSAENEKDGMGISKVHGGGYGTFAGYGRVPGLSDSTSSDKSSGLLGTIKKQVGSGFWKFISKLADMFGDGGSSNPGGSGVQRWKPDVIKALKKNGFEATASQVSAWMRVIARESNGDPTVVNNRDRNAQLGHPSKGLVQTIEPTFNANKFAGHGNILNGYDDLLAGIRYMKRIYGSGPSAFARVSGPEGYDTGGYVTTKQRAWLAETNPEFVVNPQRDSADDLLAGAMTARAKAAPNSFSGKMARVISGVNHSNGTMVQPNISRFSNTTTVANGNQTGGTGSGDLSVYTVLDSDVIARKTFSKQEAMRMNRITINGAGGAIPVGS